MRITHKMIGLSINNNLNKNLYRLERMSNRLSSGKKFDRPSQDPVGTLKVMRLQGSQARLEQYQRNITEGENWLLATDIALEETLNVVQRLREIALYTTSGAMTDTDRKAIMPEARELKEHLLNVANSEVYGLHIFAGHKTRQAPYVMEADGSFTYQGDDGKRVLEISQRDELVINLTGLTAFGGTELLEAASQVQQALEDNDHEALGTVILTRLDNAIESLLQARAEAGGKIGRLEIARQRLFTQGIHLRETRSRVEDLDYAEAIMEYTMQESAYQAALSTGARMIQPSLVDYLR